MHLAVLDNDPLDLELLEDLSEMLVLVLRCLGVYENVIQVSETEVEVPQDVVHLALESLGGVTEGQRI